MAIEVAEDKNLEYILDLQDFFPTFVEVFKFNCQIKENEIIMACLKSIEKLIKYGEDQMQRENLSSNPILNALHADKIEYLVEQLQNNEQIEIYKLSFHLMDEYFMNI